MRLLVLPQVLHGGEVHSVEINSVNRLAATAGSDRFVNIWGLPLLLTVNLLSQSELTLIAPFKVLDIHEHPPSSIKWSPTDEDVIATGDTNGYLYILNIADNTNKLVYFRPSASQESAQDIIDISWSADGRLLFWSTANGKVHLYDCKKDTYQEFISDKTVSENGKATVRRSVAFDPSNNYLITMGDDTYLHVYQYRYDANDNYQFKIINRISKLMNNNPSPANAFAYKKPSWSCDGEYFSVPTASKQQTSLISLLSRTAGWENKASLVGHDMDCNVVRFAPHVFQMRDDSSESGDGYSVYHIIASAGSDKTLALWNTSKESPLIVLRDLTTKPIVDVAWEKSGHGLILATLDGHLVILNFDPHELGDFISHDLLQKLEESQKGSIHPLNTKEPESGSQKKSSKSASDIIDQKDAVKLEDSFVDNTTNTLVPETTESVADPEQPSSANTHEVVGDVTPVVLKSNSPGQVDDILSSAMGVRTKETQQRPKQATKPAAKADPPAQKVSQKDGKKRIQPMLISTAKNEDSEPLSKKSETSTLSSSTNGAPTKSHMEFEKPSYSVSEEAFKDSKRNKAQEDGAPTKKAKRDLEPTKFIGSVVVNPNTAFSKVRLSVPKARVSFQHTSQKDGTMTLDVRNGQGNETAPTRITYFKNETPIWTDFIPRFVHLAAEGDSFWALCTGDGQIVTYHHNSGKRLLPPFVLGAPVSFLETHGDFLMAVTSVAEIYVWDLKHKKIHLRAPHTLASLLDLNSKFEEDTLSKADNITMCAITSKGIPLVTLANGSGYLYNDDLGVWQTVSEAWWAFGSHYWDSIGDDKGSSEPQMSGILGNTQQSSIIGLLEHKTNEEILRKSRLGRGKYFNKISKNMIMKEGFENLENTISLSHLENRILCCEILDETKDFHNFLMTYAKRLCELGLQAKLFEVCDKLLVQDKQDGMMNGESNGVENTRVCGHDKKELLKEIIFACAKNRDVQRILGYFANKLGLIEADYQ